ncbi:peptidase S8/S53 domain-containing protein [Plectosphaerella plurivora]|uniref:Peptidase S8/S53 domain-containing protein n=1 Tax=Plectosphaerella plurivora TaxID=936078 RepID=A0A9P8UYI0_9PEZI|nr:peptidase S8/S53 domain-containing protein [Plectosphaerella plurivora]
MKTQTALLSLLCSVASVVAAPTDDAPGADNAPKVVPGAYIVEFEDSLDTPSFYDNLKAEDFDVDSRLDLTFSLFKGCSFQLKNVTDLDVAAKRISDLPTIKKIWPVRIHERPDDKFIWAGNGTSGARAGLLRKRQTSDEVDTFTPHRMTQVDKLRAENITGQGIRIAVVDSGIDYHHPALGNGCFGPGCLVSYGRDLVGDDYTGSNTPIPDDDPRDCEGHGTHVAGIIAAQSNELGFTGVAPGVTLGAYKVFGCGGGLSEDLLLAAFNEAYEAGSDIITASIAGVSGWSEDAMSVAIGRIVDAGVPCTFGAGNTGSGGLFYASSPANGKKVTGVGSVDSEDTPLILKDGTFTVDNGTIDHFAWEAGYPEYPNVTLPLWAVSNTSNVTDDACGPLPDDTPNLSGFIVLVRAGTCGYDFKAGNIVAKGAKYMLLYSNEDGLRYPYVPDDVGISGAAMVPSEQGEEWLSLLNQGEEVTVTVVEPSHAANAVTFTANEQTGGFISDFSSWGPTWDLEFSPRFVAPGGSIVSTYPLAKGGYAVVSGTSMATPFVAAAYALIAQVRGTTDPSTLERALSGTSKALRWVLDPARGLAPAPQQGAGLIQVHDAAYTTTLLSVSSLAFNDTANFEPNQSFSIQNLGSEDVTYEISHSPALTMYTFEGDSPRPANFPNPIANETASFDFSSTKITVPAGQEAEISLTVTPPAGLDERLLPIYSGFINVTGSNGKSLAIPYQGAVGSMYNISRILSEGYVYLSTWTDGMLNPVPANTTFTIPYPRTPEPLSGVDYPASLIELNTGSPLLRCDVIALGPHNLNTTKVLGVDVVGSLFDFPKPHVPRRYFVSAVTGTLEDGSVLPEGTYALLVRVLRIFGDPEKPEDYQEHQMAPFTIKYA